MENDSCKISTSEHLSLRKQMRDASPPPKVCFLSKSFEETNKRIKSSLFFSLALSFLCCSLCDESLLSCSSLNEWVSDVINEENRRKERRAPFYNTCKSFVFFFEREKQFLKLGLYTLNQMQSLFFLLINSFAF